MLPTDTTTAKPLHEWARLSVQTGNAQLAYRVVQVAYHRHGLNWPGVEEWLTAHDVPIAEFVELITEAES